jgi:hypothetical protein
MELSQDLVQFQVLVSSLLNCRVQLTRLVQSVRDERAFYGRVRVLR